MTWMRMIYFQNVVIIKIKQNNAEAESGSVKSVMSDDLPHYEHPCNTNFTTKRTLSSKNN